MRELAILFAPALLVAIGIIGRIDGPGRTRVLATAVRIASAVSVVLAMGACWELARHGEMHASLISWRGMGISVWLDSLSVSLFVLVSGIGAAVLKYSQTYLDGDPRKGRFLADLSLTLAAVMTLVLSGNLFQLVVAWIATSLGLHRLLLFYRDRPAAVSAGRKKFAIARAGDLCLATAALLLTSACHSGDLRVVLDRVQAMTRPGAQVEIAAIALVLAAALKSAQFPTHGWLPDIVDTPTPVSALLHAGIINGGGFLALRFAGVLTAIPGSLILLAGIGGLTAVYGSLVLMTQTSIKAALAWSTIAQMGLMLLECGIGAFSLALVHVVAHSVYKAHGFLSSGNAVRTVAHRHPGVPRPGRASRAIGLAIALAAYIALRPCLVGVLAEPLISWALGLVVVLGLGMLLAQATPDRRPAWNLAREALLGLAAMGAYMGLHAVAHELLMHTLPPAPMPSAIEWVVLVAVLTAFVAIVFMQVIPEPLQSRAWYRAAYVHLTNGLYVDAFLARLWRRPRLQAGATL